MDEKEIRKQAIRRYEKGESPKGIYNVNVKYFSQCFGKVISQ